MNVMKRLEKILGKDSRSTILTIVVILAATVVAVTQSPEAARELFGAAGLSAFRNVLEGDEDEGSDSGSTDDQGE